MCLYRRHAAFIVLYGRRGDVYVYPPDGAVFMLYAVNRVDAFENILYWVVDRVLARLYGKALMAHILQGGNLVFNLLLSELFPCYVLVL